MRLLVTALPMIGLIISACRPEAVAPKTALGPPHFVEETATSGLVHVYDGDATFAVGGGIAVLDCNGDGKPDLYVAGGSQPAALYRNDSPIGGALKFTRVPDPQTDLTGVNGAYPIDVDTAVSKSVLQTNSIAVRTNTIHGNGMGTGKRR